MIEWEKVNDCELWKGTFYSSARMKVPGGWLIHTEVTNLNNPGQSTYGNTVFVADKKHNWNIKEQKKHYVEFLHKSEC